SQCCKKFRVPGETKPGFGQDRLVNGCCNKRSGFSSQTSFHAPFNRAGYGGGGSNLRYSRSADAFACDVDDRISTRRCTEVTVARGLDDQFAAADEFQRTAVYRAAECRPGFDGDFRPYTRRLTLADDDGTESGHECPSSRLDNGVPPQVAQI